MKLGGKVATGTTSNRENSRFFCDSCSLFLTEVDLRQLDRSKSPQNFRVGYRFRIAPSLSDLTNLRERLPISVVGFVIVTLVN